MPMLIRDTLRKYGNKAIASGGWLSLIEWLLLALLAVQLARLVWTIVTPVGSFDEWRRQLPVIPSAAASQRLFGEFDPFYHSAGGKQSSVSDTSLALTLYGTRVNSDTGIGAAIIATSDGTQSSFAIGDEITPGVVLRQVRFDHVVIERGGVAENVFITQSGTGLASSVPDTPSSASPPDGDKFVVTAPVRQQTNVASIKSDIGFAPRLQNGKITGLVLSSRGPAFQSLGFQPGDVIAQINGQPISSPADLQILQTRLVPGARIAISVERGSSVLPMELILQGE